MSGAMRNWSWCETSELIRTIEKLGAILIRHGLNTIGIRILKPRFLKQFPDIAKSMKILHV